MKPNKQARRRAKDLLRVCLVNGLLDEDRVRRVVERVIATAHRDSPAILSHFVRLVRLDRDQHTATVESAAPLPADLQAITEAGLARQYGSGLTTAFRDRPSLIGGVRIRVGSDVYDGSVLGRLAALEIRF